MYSSNDLSVPFINLNYLGNPQCGRQTIPLDPETNIIGGQPAQEGEYPWQASVWIDDGSGLQVRCGAAILTSEWVVTAANCM